MVLSIIFLIRGVEGVPNDMLRRDLHFREFVLSSTAGGVVSGIVGVSLAFYLVDHYGSSAGIWALVAYALTDALVSTSLAWVFAIRAGVWRPGSAST